MKRAIATVAAALLIGSPALAGSDHVPPPPLLSALTTTSEYIWVPLATDSELSRISRELNLSLAELAEINDKPSSTLLKAGSWVVLPKSSQDQVLRSSRFLGDNIRASAPLAALPALQGTVTIKPNQSLAQLVRDHGISIEMLRSLNPGIELSKLTIGSKVRVANAQPLLAVRPLNAGGASWPELPNFNGVNGSTVDTVQKQRIRQQIEQRRKAEQLVALREAEERRRRFRRFGSYTFDWSTWGKSGSGVRSVKSTSPYGVTEVAVDCHNYKISQLKYRKWQKWELPTGNLIDFVAESCANVLGASKPIYIEPEVIPVSRKEPKVPACTGPTILCQMP